MRINYTGREIPQNLQLSNKKKTSTASFLTAHVAVLWDVFSVAVLYETRDLHHVLQMNHRGNPYITRAVQ